MGVQSELKSLRQKRGLSVRMLAEKVGTGGAAISNIENGKQIPKIDTIERICAALDAKLKIVDKYDSNDNDSK